jgi:hypothetical protein
MIPYCKFLLDQNRKSAVKQLIAVVSTASLLRRLLQVKISEFYMNVNGNCMHVRNIGIYDIKEVLIITVG